MTRPLTVLSPTAGTALAMADVPDPVFAGAIVGPGLAVDPARMPGDVVAPVAGTVATVHPHAFVVQVADGRAVLVHLGIDTVQLGGAGFTVHVTEGGHVEAGDVVVSWDPAAVDAGGRSPVCPVVALQADGAALRHLVAAGDEVRTGQPLFEWS